MGSNKFHVCKVYVVVKPWVQGIIADNCPDPKDEAQWRESGWLCSNNSNSCPYIIVTISNSVKDQIKREYCCLDGKNYVHLMQWGSSQNIDNKKCISYPFRILQTKKWGIWTQTASHFLLLFIFSNGWSWIPTRLRWMLTTRSSSRRFQRSSRTSLIIGKGWH